MLRTFRLGRLFGFPIEVNLTFLLMLGVIFLSFGGLAGVFTVLLAFASVLAHELGHALVARRLGVPIVGIELHFFGGAAKMGHLPRSARDEILIASAGPAVSLVLAGLGLGLGMLSGIGIVAYLGWINLLLGGFNLVPALPMDGGRVLRAALSKRMGFRGATETSVKVSRVFSVLFGVVGLWTGQYMLAALGVVLWWMSSHEQRAAALFRGYAAAPLAPGGPAVEILGPGELPRSGGFRAGGGYPASPSVSELQGGARFLLVRGPDGRLRIEIIS